MKVSAIRVAEWGRFRRPTAVEGFRGGLDLLTGPNEAGKSTIFKALQFVFEHRHRTTRGEVAEMRPYAGGAPVIEVDFELSGRAWRIRKRYLSSPSAELLCRSTGTVSRGNDAEEALEGLLTAAGVGGARTLLWPRQGELLAEKQQIDKAGGDILRTAIEREISRAAGGEAVRRLRTAVRKALEPLISLKQQKPRGHFHAVLARAGEAPAELEAMRSDFKTVERLFDRLADIDAELLRQNDPARRAALVKSLSDAEQRLQSARQGRAEMAAAQLSLAEAQAAYRGAAAELATLDEGLAKLQKLEQAQRDGELEAADLAQILLTADAHATAADAAYHEARDKLAEAELASRRLAALERCRDLSNRLERARAAAVRIEELQQLLSGLPLDPSPVREARALTARIAEGTAHLDAASAAVTVRYDEGAPHRVKAVGKDLADGERLLTQDRLIIEIPGIGRIEIEPGVSRDRDRIAVDLDRDKCRLAELLAAAGAVDLTAFEACHERAQATSASLESARAELRAIAPDGLTALGRRFDDSATEAGDDWERDETAICLKASASLLGEWQARLKETGGALRESEAAREALGRKAAVLEARAGERHDQLATLTATLPPQDERALARERAASTAERAGRSLDEALRIDRLAASRAIDDDGLRRLEREVSDARDACRQSERQIEALENDRGRIDVELAARRREDVVERIAALEAEVERVQTIRDDLVEEVQALQLLDAELVAEEDRLRENYATPVLTRLAPYLTSVFPQAELTLGADYAVEALQRGTHGEAFVRLSDGTREQVAVLVRLAFARLLADQGMAVPLILDDALVYSDDERISDMLRALEIAAESHQVIVLTCREQAFSGLRGHRLEMVPWQLVPA